MKRMYIKKIKRLNFTSIIIVLIVISVIYIINIFNKKITPFFVEYSLVETKKIASLIINSSISEEVANNIELNDLFLTTKDSTGKITSIDIKSSEANKLLVKATNVVEKNLLYLETGELDKLNIQDKYFNKKLKNGIIFEIPSGLIFENGLLYNILPKIPVKLEILGNTICKLNTEVESYGINNALIKVNIDASVDIKILLPYTSKINTYVISVPIIMKVIQGSVPSYYLNGYLDSPIYSSN